MFLMLHFFKFAVLYNFIFGVGGQQTTKSLREAKSQSQKRKDLAELLTNPKQQIQKCKNKKSSGNKYFNCNTYYSRRIKIE